VNLLDSSAGGTGSLSHFSWSLSIAYGIQNKRDLFLIAMLLPGGKLLYYHVI
jgi:hypothetical protein